MSFNKYQGKEMDSVPLDFRNPIFSLVGPPYGALSRVRDGSKVAILTNKDSQLKIGYEQSFPEVSNILCP